MSQSDFETLVAGVCERIGLTQPEGVLRGEGIVFDGVYFSIAYNEKVCPHSVFVYFDYGVPPRAFENLVFAHLLKENEHRIRRQLPIFSIAPQGDRVVGMHRFSVKGITAAQLVEQMTYMAAAVNSWKEIDWSAVAGRDRVVTR
ncbi:hypothetical protein FKG94_12730 [Exilibacterium tricleocarpae]|uniref:Uncharacterized protein n=1 Tax=Exilibacterium tricleocarpae TaxID=2591008 RepID=A0A545TNW1_9GAMM|nr:hypothetical protein [Exilibacterium tricleocarpae]TQV78878.1 hypothetical protein FKG94_12730 [Exilibacterium tricleocarpae]